MANRELVEIREKHAEKRKWVDKFLAQANTTKGDDGRETYDLSGVTLVEGSNKVKTEALNRTRKEMEDLWTRGLELHAGEQAAVTSASHGKSLKTISRPGIQMPSTVQEFNLGKAVTSSPEFKHVVESRNYDGTLWTVEGDGGSLQALAAQHQKALFSQTSGWVPYSTETPLVVPAARRPVQVLPHIRQIPTDQAAVIWNKQTTRTLATAERAEGAAYPEGTLVYTRQTTPVETIGSFIPISKEQMDDTPMMESLINNDLIAGCMERVDLQIIAGNGSSPNLQGITDGGNGLTGTQNLDKASGFTELQGIVRCMGLVANSASGGGQAMASLIVTSTIRWYSYMETRTTEGWFLFGLGATQPSLFGVPVAVHDGIPQHNSNDQIIVGDFQRFSHIRDRQAAQVRVESRHRVSSSMTVPTGQISLVADCRAAMIWERPAAFVLFQELT